MTHIHTRALAAAALLAATLAPAPAAANLPVFDVTNYTQNVLQAARALEQIDNQVRSLQNQAAMLQNMARNLQHIDFPELGRLTSAMQQIDRLMGQASGIDFRVDQLDQRLRTLFPGGVDAAASSDRRVAAARSRLDAAMAGFRQSMGLQAQVVENVRDDAAMLQRLSDRSSSAEGALEVGQATNQLLALAAKQQLQLQSLIAAEFRSQDLDRAGQAQSSAEARDAARRFLGSGRAYTP